MARSSAAVACVLVALVAFASAQDAPAPSIAFAPTEDITTAQAPAPTAYTKNRGKHAADDLSGTPTSYNQLQTIGSYSSAHVAPSKAITAFLNTTDVKAAADPSANIPDSTQFTQQELYFQLETSGARQFHFPIYYDPNGTLYQLNAGLKIVNQSSNATEVVTEKLSYPGWKVFNDPNFDWNTTCYTLSTCLFNIKNWILSTPNPLPITIYLEPTTYTFIDPASTVATDALKASNQTDGPTELATPAPIESIDFYSLDYELLYVFDNNTYFSIITPDDIRGEGSDSLKSAVLKDGYTLWPSLNSMKTRVLFVLTGNASDGTPYSELYLKNYPNLVNATMFVAEPYKADGNYSDSTLFVDVVGPIANTTGATFDNKTALDAVTQQASYVTKAVKAGYMVRASADWNTLEARNGFAARAQKLLAAGAHFLQTSFLTTPTLFKSTYNVALPIRGGTQQAGRCNPVTSGGVLFNASSLYTVGCPALNDLTPATAPSVSASSL
jgi:hypothetical protein